LRRSLSILAWTVRQLPKIGTVDHATVLEAIKRSERSKDESIQKWGEVLLCGPEFLGDRDSLVDDPILKQ
jgi:polynucleotide 5'-kinase involved in rRNA processing